MDTSYPTHSVLQGDNNLQSNQSRSPLVRQLRLFLDYDKLLCCGGQIYNGQVIKVSLPSTILTLFHSTCNSTHAHAVQLHIGVNAILTTVWQQYWIPSACQQIRSIIYRCVVCKETSGKLYSKSDPPPLVSKPIKSLCSDWSGLHRCPVCLHY